MRMSLADFEKKFSESSTPALTRRGRPKGSKNKPKSVEKLDERTDAEIEQLFVHDGRAEAHIDRDATLPMETYGSEDVIDWWERWDVGASIDDIVYASGARREWVIAELGVTGLDVLRFPRAIKASNKPASPSQDLWKSKSDAERELDERMLERAIAGRLTQDDEAIIAALRKIGGSDGLRTLWPRHLRFAKSMDHVKLMKRSYMPISAHQRYMDRVAGPERVIIARELRRAGLMGGAPGSNQYWT